MNAKRILALLCLAAAGCGANDGSSIQVVGRVATPTASANTACTFATGTYTSGGILDLQGALTYLLPVEVDNNMADPGTNGTGSPAALTWTAEKVRTRIVSTGFTPQLLTVPAESIMPADTTSVKEGTKQVLFVPLVQPALGAQIKAAAGSFSGFKTVEIGYQLLGRTADDGTHDTAEKFYSIEICDGCLLAQPTCATGKTLTRAPSCFDPGQDQSLYVCQ
ncbi:hypothetical protein [Anaeromyxobacter paludicola]|uniref:Lipoprotein n=1 Tax=Anaeromyxobacter paludicola TaxID=2918171 RepID=A0ABN6N787_9BACT|nr:hypothetical protein [Anaeromyxobacter paludicola]BDG09023.1 hypothetical protein AMPC_21360 [Anaeromyxobacter paludicola]